MMENINSVAEISTCLCLSNGFQFRIISKNGRKFLQNVSNNDFFCMKDFPDGVDTIYERLHKMKGKEYFKISFKNKVYFIDPETGNTETDDTFVSDEISLNTDQNQKKGEGNIGFNINNMNDEHVKRGTTKDDIEDEIDDIIRQDFILGEVGGMEI